MAFSGFSAADLVTVALAALFVGLVTAIIVRAWRIRQPSQEEKERMRRAQIVATGKLGHAKLADVRDGALFYTYAVRGVEYTASQDVTALLSLLPAGPTAMEPVFVKYDPRNPANSIILAEHWSGFGNTKPSSQIQEMQ